MYSQHGEDEIVAKLWGDRGTGRLLDIGAWGVKDLSNSRMLIEQGWVALLVEFSPGPVRALVQEYADQQHVFVLAAAITSCDQHCLQFDVTDDALSATPDSDTRRIWGEQGGYFGRLWVPTITVERLLEQFAGARDFDFVSIDTEGTSVHIAVEYLKHRQPSIMCVEHDGKIVELMAIAQPMGYTAAHVNETNVILSRI